MVTKATSPSLELQNKKSINILILYYRYIISNISDSCTIFVSFCFGLLLLYRHCETEDTKNIRVILQCVLHSGCTKQRCASET